jgi:hypothetical protein
VDRLRLIHWNAAEAAPLLEKLRAAGYAVDYDEKLDYRILRALRDSSPVAIVIDLSRRPSHGREVAVYLRGNKATRQIPLVFVDGAPEKVTAIREVLPDAVYANSRSATNAVRRAIAKAPAQPVAPPQMMERYHDRTTAQKLGIKPGARVALIDPPADYSRVLGDLPAGASLEEDPHEPCDVTLWFARDPVDCHAAFPAMRSRAGRTKLWILWQKQAAGGKAGVTQNMLRETAVSLGLVDYKICAVNATWSGMAFALSGRKEQSPARSRAGKPRKNPPRRA